ncbi:MAG: macro domain-containing protein [Chloroflexia bacterium]|nr:macro domain-containing protein [Chloroflexia bacterium]
MVKVIDGDLFASDAQTLVNTVNCVGVMGKGVALEFKKRFPDMYKDYVARCDRHGVRLGRPYLFRHLTLPWVLDFPTKDHWRSVTKLSDIEEGLRYLTEHYEEWGITSMAVPPLGCGNGQLEWRIVGPTLYRYLSEINLPVELYAPHGTPHEELQPEFLDEDRSSASPPVAMPEPQWVPPEWVVIAEIVKRIQDEPYHQPIGRTIFQKIAYVATVQGLTTGLDCKRASYGPFAPDLKGMMARLINNGLIVETTNGKMQQISMGPTYVAARKAYQDDVAWWEPVIARTVDLFLRLDSIGAEIVASSLFTAREMADAGTEPTERMVFEAVMEWKKRRRPALDEGTVATTIRTLAARDWLTVQSSADLPLPSHELIYA